MIVKRNGEYCLLTKDGSETIKCHPTREKAVAQEAAIMASKAARGTEGFAGKDGRESAARRGYDYAWKKTRDAFLLKHPKCNYQGCKDSATEAEHVSSKPARLGGSDAWSGLQPRCKSHHSKKTAGIDGGFGNPKKDRESKAAMEDDMDLQSHSDDERPVRAFLTKLKDLLKGKVSDDDFKSAIKTARSHAGGKAIKKKKDVVAPEDAEKIAAGEWGELWLNSEEMSRVSESSADDMAVAGVSEIKIFGEEEEPTLVLERVIIEFETLLTEGDTQAKAAVSLSEEPAHQELGFFQRCLPTVSKKADNPNAFCAWFHRKLIGSWPGEEKASEEGPFLGFDDEAVTGYPAPKLAKTDVAVKYKASGPERCRECQFFLAPQGCRFVEGTIDREYWCKLWRVRPAMFEEGADADLDAMIEDLSDVLDGPHEFQGKVPPAFLKFQKKKKGAGAKDDDDDDEDGKKKKKKLPPFLAKKLGKATELYDFNEFRGEQEHRSDWRLFLELGTDPEWIPYLPKPGSYKHPKYGNIAVTRARNERFVSNFTGKVYQETLPIDAEHSPKTSGAMGWVVGMKTNEDGSADANVKWTDRGRDMLEKDRFRYFSPEWYNVWEDPSTGKKHFDVAIGGALTTRPFFKEGALRSLVACESGIYSPIRGTFFCKENTMKIEDKKASGEGGGDVDPQTFEELVESNRKLTERVEAQDKDLKKATENVTKLETSAQRKTITDIVMGKDEKVGGPRWFGEPEKNVSFLEKMADKFGGLESEECQQYIEQQKAHAEQIAASSLLTTSGSDNSGDPVGKGAASEFNALAEKRLADKQKAGVENFTLGDAMSEIATEQPTLHQRYTEESAVRI